MEAKGFLKQLGGIRRHIAALQETKSRLLLSAYAPAAPSMSGKPRGTGFGSAVESKMTRLDALDARILDELDALAAAEADILDAIASVPDHDLQTILIRHYVNGHTWKKTADLAHYSYHHVVHRLHPKALRCIQDYLDAKEATQRNSTSC